MKKLLTLALALVLALSSVGALAAEYSDKATVKKVQQALNDAGYNCGTPDGAAGKKTKTAIKDYQSANGLNATGAIDDELLTALGLAEEEAPAETVEEAPANTTEESAATGEGYTFQGIPWGSSPEEVKAILVENGLIEVETGIDGEGSVLVFPDTLNAQSFFDTYMSIVGIDNIGGYSWLTNIQKTIGGSEVRDIYCYYLYGISDGTINDELHLSDVLISFKDASGYDELTQGLSDSYGTYSESKYGMDYFNLNMRSWTGENNTIIILAKSDAMGLQLVYAKTDDYTVVRKIQEINEANKAPVADAGL